MRLHVLGSNGTYPTPGRPASGHLVRTEAGIIWLDVGPGTVGPFQAQASPSELAAVVISHVHADHCSDLLMLLNLVRFGPDGIAPIPLFTADGVLDRLAAFVAAGPGHAFHDVFAAETVAGGDERTIGSATLRFGDAAHNVPAIATSVAEVGRRLVYSGDTGPGGDLEALAAGADVLLCEATHQGERPDDGWPHHLHAVEAGEIAQQAQVGTLVLTHVAPTLDGERSRTEAAARFSGRIELAVPGMELET